MFGFDSYNIDYNPVMNNYSQESMKALFLGVFNDGTSVKHYVSIFGYDISLVPNINMYNMHRAIYNDAFTRQQYDDVMNQYIYRYASVLFG